MRTTTVVIGAGQSGLAMSRCLSERSIDHVVLERNEVANSWRHERWDSLRLLTPNWQCRLPGHAYSGDDPDGFMSASEVVDFITEYAKLIDGAGDGWHDGVIGASCRRGLSGTTDQGEWLLHDRRSGFRSVQRSQRAGLRGGCPTAQSRR